MTDEPTLSEIRLEAQKKMKGICTVNKVCDGAPIRFCQGQKYGASIGLGGTGKGLGFTANVDALDAVKLKTRLITPHKKPDTSTTLFGREVSLPVMASSVSGVAVSMGGGMEEFDFAKCILQGCVDAGSFGFIGNTATVDPYDAQIKAVKEVGIGVNIFKPQANEEIINLMAAAKEAGAIAVGVDLDGCGSTNWERAGKPVYRKSKEDLKELVEATSLPFIAKGIMSVEDALDAVDAGVSGIDVSNHGGRALDSTKGVAEVLPYIVKAVDGKVTVTAGGGVRTGFDVLKLLALGADGVLLGRDIIRSVLGGGARGVKLHLDYILSDLVRGMVLTSCNSIADIDEKIIEK